MPIETPIPPKLLRRILEFEGYNVVKEDELNWAFFKEGTVHPVILPHDIDLVPVDVMSSILDQVKMPPGLYLAHLAQARSESLTTHRPAS